ncbi:DUF6615 family protein [Kribbella sp. NPDC049227]|uniref:DUF6615 family protein n=1 Tax=Kribbella sp. NPDC049227 TaxID=3364113 RepID=UPI0037173462
MTLHQSDRPPATLLEALTRIRVRAEEHMDRQDRDGLGWTEETVTEIAIGAGTPLVKPIPFNRPQESAVGADWLWWWLDRSSQECFGMLVQAKRIKGGPSRWKLDVSHGNGAQQRNLIATADQFNVPAIYGVYMGGLVLRRDLKCSHGRVLPCLSCARMAVTLMPAYSLPATRDQGALFDLTLAEGVPLEDLGDPDRPTGVIRDVNFRQLRPGVLREFLVDPQSGPREVAKHIFKSVSTRRDGQKSAALAEPVELVGQQIFQELPRDRGHFPGPYFPHVLRGLRKNPPSYVHDLIAGFPPPSDISGAVAGVVLVLI